MHRQIADIVRNQMARQISLRPATAEDKRFMWEMLRYATYPPRSPSLPAADVRRDERATRYLAGWGWPGDHGVIAGEKGRQIGAACIGPSGTMHQDTDSSIESIPELDEHRWMIRVAGDGSIELDPVRRRDR
jgi:hypothetical protein